MAQTSNGGSANGKTRGRSAPVSTPPIEDDGIYKRSNPDWELHQQLQNIGLQDPEKLEGLLRTLLHIEDQRRIEDAFGDRFFFDLKQKVEHEISCIDDVGEPNFTQRALALDLEWGLFHRLYELGVSESHEGTQEDQWRSKALALRVAVAWAYKIGWLLSECLVFRESQHNTAGRGTALGGDMGARAKHAKLAPFERVAVEEFEKIRRDHPAWSRNQALKETAEMESVKKARIMALDLEKNPQASVSRSAIASAVRRSLERAGKWKLAT